MKIPVVDLDNNLDPAITKKAGVDIAFHIGSDNEAAGAKGADYLVSALGKDAKGPKAFPAISRARSGPVASPMS
jgi:ABC-type sugar transport system substrate-binding protein